MEIMQDISSLAPKMWGPSIIGFGSYHYKYESGREGDMPQLAFSPRKAAVTLYIQGGFDRYGQQLARLGKHKTGVGCLYLNNLADADLGILREILEDIYRRGTGPAGKAVTVEDYVAQVPEATRPQFDELRNLVKELLPGARELVSYGILGYKIDDKRARVFISGWNDHLAIYPVPHDEALAAELKPYVKGKGTLWFGLDKPLPQALIKRVILALTSA